MATFLATSALIADDANDVTAIEIDQAVPEFPIGPELANFTADEIENAYQGRTPPEAIRMYLAIVKGSMMGAGDGWFGPAQSKYNWNWLAERHGIESEGEIDGDAFQGADVWFERLDRNRDGKITADDMNWSDRHPWVQQAYNVNRLFRKIDPNGDGKLAREEWLAFFDKASGGKNELTADDLRNAWLAGLSAGFNPGDAPSKETLLQGLFSGEVGSLQEGPQVGENAPDFFLKTQDGQQKIRLSEKTGSKPVVLVFGNFTCGPFRSMYPGVEEISRRFKDDAVFIGVYVREAHPTDGWNMESNSKVGVSVAQPKTYEERIAVASQCHLMLKPTIPLLVDGIDDPVGNAYSGMPARMYVIDTEGKVVYKSGRGPFGFKTGEMEQALLMTLMDEHSSGRGANEKRDSDSASRGKPPAGSAGVLPAGEKAVTMLSSNECWKRMPQAVSGAGQNLPHWACAVASQLPRTAAAMLQLDFAQRTKSPLDPVLRAKMRWVIAHANRCAYSEACAVADLERAGADAAARLLLVGDPAAWPAADREPLEFARLLTVAAPTIPDALFERLRTRYGDKRVASMVLLAAYGNFQDRIVLGLNLPIEDNGPLPPLDITFADDAFQIAPLIPAHTALVTSIESGKNVVAEDREWSRLSYDDLQSRMELQRDRKPRLPIPDWDNVRKNIPPAMVSRPTRIVWSLVCLGYVPELAVPWSITTRTMWAESKPDRVFEESLFWIQTRSIECNYCMGHCEMLLEVAGLDKKEVADRTRRLASSDWSSFPVAEQRAYAYARTLSKRPWDLKPADYRELEADLGPETGMATFWWLCRGLYMTRISDGFQLPLERENVFQ